jgi:hypothetical protein
MGGGVGLYIFLHDVYVDLRLIDFSMYRRHTHVTRIRPMETLVEGMITSGGNSAPGPVRITRAG